jgi:hypothetical protein
MEAGTRLTLFETCRRVRPAADSRSGPERGLAEKRFLVGAIAEKLS